MWGNKIMQRKRGEKYHALYGSLAPECSVNYLWKCWQKRSRFNKARFSGGQQQPTVRWGLGLSCSLWILMMVHRSRYANPHCSFSPVSAETSGCVWICNLCCSSPPPHFFYFFNFYTLTPSLPLSVFPLVASVYYHPPPPLFAFNTSSSCFETSRLHCVSFWMTLVPSVCSPSQTSQTSLSVCCKPQTQPLMIDAALKIM